MAIDPSDPYFLQHGALAKQLAALINQYGSSSQLTPGYAQEFGLGQGDVSAANQNPYSTVQQLAQQLAGDQTGIQNTAAAHGATFSGANAAATQHEIQAAGQRNYNAQQTLQQQLAGLQTTDLGNLTDATGRAATAALNDPTLAPVPAAPAPAAPAAYMPTAGPITYDGPKGAEVAVAPKPPKPPKPKLPTLGGLGHVT